VRVPSLRDRREDIPLLCQHFLDYYSRQMEKRVRGIAPDVMHVFLEHEWRGNVRELEKTVKRLVVLADEGGVLGADLLPLEMLEAANLRTSGDPQARGNGKEHGNGNGAGNGRPAATHGLTLRSNVSDLERRMIAQALDRNRWNRARTARELGLSYPTLLSKIRSLRIEKPASVD
jgi:DNA-binding NtrC family response regulator